MEKIIATTVIGRINLLKKDINGSAPYGRDVEPFNPQFVSFQIAKRGDHTKRK